MALKLKTIHEKLPGDVKDINVFPFIAMVLVPRLKLKSLEWCIGELYDEADAEFLVDLLNKTLVSVFNCYCSLLKAEDRPQPSLPSMKSFNELIIARRPAEGKTELERYLEECVEDIDDSFDVLQWWKSNSYRYEVLSLMARNFLAMPMSTTSPESFLTEEGCVLDLHRSYLPHQTLDAMILCSRLATCFVSYASLHGREPDGRMWNI